MASGKSIAMNAHVRFGAQLMRLALGHQTHRRKDLRVDAKAHAGLVAGTLKGRLVVAALGQLRDHAISTSKPSATPPERASA